MESVMHLRKSESELLSKPQSEFKRLYEDPKKDPTYKYQTSPFKKPKNGIERKFDSFLKRIKDNDAQVEATSLRSQRLQKLPMLNSVNKAFATFDSTGN